MLTFGKRLLLLALLLVAGITVSGIMSTLVDMLVSNPQAVVRIRGVLLDLLGFVIPAVVVALMVTRLPADFLQINRMPRVAWHNSALAVLCMIALVPVISNLAEWNAGLNFGVFEQWMREYEDASSETVRLMLGADSVMDLILGILIVGVLAGFSEELLFRGALQRLLMTKPMNPHAAIWITAVVFSAIHMQFFGFFPRLLLGVLLGYVAWWSGSLWPAVIAHVFNNSMAVTVRWLALRELIPKSVESFGEGSPMWFTSGLIVSGFLVWLISRNSCAGK